MHVVSPVREERAAAAGGERLRYLIVVAIAVALCVLAAALSFSGALRATVPWLDGSGGLTRGGLPLVELAGRAAGAITVGLLLAGALLLPSGPDGLSPPARRCCAAARPMAAGWAIAALVTALLADSYLLGKPVWRVTGGDLLSFCTDLAQGRALVAVALPALLISLAPIATAGRALGMLLVALAALLPPVVTGHAMTADYHTVAVFSLAVHVVAAAAWVGGLVVLAVLAYPARELLAAIVPRFSTLALVCFLAVAASGVVNAWSRLGGAEALLGSRYGVLVCVKAVALLGLGLIGYWHRQASIPGLRAQRMGVFVRLAAIEVVVMGAAMALAVALSRTPPPGDDAGPATPAGILLGFEPPGPAGPASYTLDWWIDPLFLCLVIGGAGLYLAGVARLRRAGGGWPVRRTLAWLGGLLIVLVATSGGLARYSMVLFSAHLVQHLALTLLAPIPLLLGAPVTLVLRTLRRDAETIGRTPRELLTNALSSRPARLLAHPAAALAVLVGGLYGFYATPLFEASLRNSLLHSVTMVVFLAAGTVFVRAAVRSRRLALAALPFLLAFGLAFARSGSVVAADWYRAVAPAWTADPLADQRTGGLLGLVIAVIGTGLVLGMGALRGTRRAR
jgi:cytochrome c oxidase assembly factor CtaG/putative copper export protein